MTERRFTAKDFDEDFPPMIREASSGKMRLKGYAAVFDLPSVPLWSPEGMFVEVIADGAFTRTLREQADVTALFNHDDDQLLARSSAGTLRLMEDRFGLLADFDVAENYIGQAAFEWVRRRDVTKMSFAFRVVAEEWDFRGKQITRTIFEVDLFDVSAVTHPAYLQTAIDVAGRADSFVEMVAKRYEIGPDIDTMRRQLRLQELA